MVKHRGGISTNQREVLRRMARGQELAFVGVRRPGTPRRGWDFDCFTVTCCGRHGMRALEDKGLIRFLRVSMTDCFSSIYEITQAGRAAA